MQYQNATDAGEVSRSSLEPSSIFASKQLSRLENPSDRGPCISGLSKNINWSLCSSVVGTALGPVLFGFAVLCDWESKGLRTRSSEVQGSGKTDKKTVKELETWLK
jgi:hypothetical protein